ncbi:NAD(P)(+) transhydrogenase (Re/Si-specific) subunit beta [Halapricum desulfuricans]|uniref:NAD(P) transhydrogenase subunit beta n=1 Tax=Halapricum desulfuricans TaxID=2841257 RepID=A0A897NGD7_9EURY|nr:NAD(P)(+) transhydrogenase (Re/Si-specific) subunit beta [Halapricum desulfuricans]QSG09959.1 NAD(P) transhydrogenase beta subunit [Halapricum desulfuricans]QSG10953.1 NAD(P) transhydrogenase beta subunit [Halapricum desulfuricans]
MADGILAQQFDEQVLQLVYLVAAIMFIQGLRDMTHPRTATRGNLISSGGMFLAVTITVLWFEILSPAVLAAGLLVGGAIGAYLAVAVETTEMPQLVGLFNGFGGGASAVVAGAELVDVFAGGGPLSVELTASAAVAAIIGSVTFSGSFVAAGKLHGVVGDSPVGTNTGHALKVAFLSVALVAGTVLVVQPSLFGGVPTAEWIPVYWLVVAAALLLGVFLVVPIGGADMPVVISLLNSYSGLAAATTGFVLNNTVLIVAGTLVGAAGMILTIIMCESMNRSLANVFFGGLGGDDDSEEMEDIYEGNITETSPEEVVMLMETADRVVIVPGYGMAVAQAQHAVAELVELLEDNGVDVEFGIHPVAGRMPGHMNALLAEADVPYDKMRELEEVNPTFSQTDLVIVTGANDVVNPRANEDDGSPISGMPILNVDQARHVVVNKRSLSPGFSGIANPLFARDNASMLFGDAKESMQALVNEYKEATS